jgi:hypothetical protein
MEEFKLKCRRPVSFFRDLSWLNPLSIICVKSVIELISVPRILKKSSYIISNNGCGCRKLEKIISLMYIIVTLF